MQLTGQKREKLGKKADLVRQEGLIPAVIFGKGLDSLSVSVDYNDFSEVFEKAGETSVIDLMVEGKKHPVLIKEIQEHHITSEPIHIGFYEVNLKEKTRANIPVEIINEKENDLIRSGEAIVLLILDEIEVEALPTDFPEKFIVDASALPEIDSVLTIADLDFDREKVEVVDLEPDEVLAKLDYAQMLEEEEEEEVSEEEAMAEIEATEEKGEEVEGEEGEQEPQPKETEEPAGE
jgi:large subunit ribosomal protein L25